jgi:hypothetical protein
MRIDVEPFKTLVMRLQFVMGHALRCHHFVPRILIADQKRQNVNVCEEICQIASDVTSLSTVIAGDESWIYGYNPEAMQQSSQWESQNSSIPKKTRQLKSKVKRMLIIFVDIIKNSSRQTKQSLPHTTVMIYAE